MIDLDPGVEVEVADWFWVEERGGNGYHVVAGDDALIWQALRGPDFDFGTDATGGSGDESVDEVIVELYELLPSAP